MKYLATLFLTLLLAACATIFSGSHQRIGFTSTPPGATVAVDGITLGTTPASAKLSRSREHVVRIALDGYQPYEITLTRNVNNWVWGNIVLGGIIGVAIDGLSGGFYKLTPKQVDAVLPTATAYHTSSHDLQVLVVLKPDSAWQRIGTLSR